MGLRKGHLKGGKSQSQIPIISKELCERLLSDLEKAKRPVLYATKFFFIRKRSDNPGLC